MQHYSRQRQSATFGEDTGGYAEPGAVRFQGGRQPARNARHTRETAVQRYTTTQQRLNRGSHEEEDLDGDDGGPARFPRSAIRYDTARAPIPPGPYIRGSTQLNVSYAAPPGAGQRPARAALLQSSPDELVPQRPHRRGTVQVHWLLFVGIALMLMIAGWLAFTDLGALWQTHQDDSTYGNPRIFQTDAVVGHGDSNSNPSHFIALNLKGDIVVIEIPGGNVKNARSYPITTLPGNQNNPPVKLVFQDLNHDGKVDMLVQIGDPPNTITFMLFNNGTQFVGKL
jgi:hypothetical protein